MSHVDFRCNGGLSVMHNQFERGSRGSAGMPDLKYPPRSSERRSVFFRQAGQAYPIQKKRENGMGRLLCSLDLNRRKNCAGHWDAVSGSRRGNPEVLQAGASRAARLRPGDRRRLCRGAMQPLMLVLFLALHSAATAAGVEECRAFCGLSRSDPCEPYSSEDPAIGLHRFDLSVGYGPPEYLPPSADILSSSSPLIPRGAFAAARGPNVFPSRMTHGVVDLVTGLPMIQAVDFELPFGGAVFRHVRTFSADFDANYTLVGGAPLENLSVTRWDLNGRGWMMSEQPFLLIDAEYAWMDAPQRRCVMIVDSFHSIPFLYDENQEKHIAPPWFDAVFSDNGPQAPDNRPSEFYVWLHRGQVKYTFTANYTDFEDLDGNPREDPYYGLVTRIEDRHGNAVEYEYCAPVASEYYNDAYETDCCRIECRQQGQLKAVRLRTAGTSSQAGSVAWTLLYTYRSYGPPGVEQDVFEVKRFVHSIHVYAGNVASPESCMTILDYFDNDETTGPFCGAESLDEVDALDHEDLPTGWVTQARYTYQGYGFGCNLFDERECYYGDLFRCAPAFVECSTDPAPGNPPIDGFLAKATVQRAAEIGSAPPEPMHTLYFYEVTGGSSWPDNSGFGGYAAVPLVSEVYEPDTVARLKALTDLSANELLDVTRDTPITVPAQTETVPFADFADLTIGYNCIDGFNVYPYDCETCGSEEGCQNCRETGTCGGIEDYFVEDYLFSDPERTWILRHNVTHLVDRRADSPTMGDFSFYFFLTGPPCTSAFGAPDGGGLGQMGYYPHLLPYGVRNDCHSGQNPNQSGLETPVLAVIVDHVDGDWNAYDPDEDEGVKLRRLIEFNRAGFPLFEQAWEFTEEGQQTVAYSGYRETRWYDFNEDPEGDNFGYLLEIRSTGWNSEANQQGQETDPADEGLIRVFAYEDSEGTREDGRLTEVEAVGVKRGTDGDPLWLSRIDRENEDQPDLVTSEVSFPEPVVGDYSTADGDVTEYVYEFYDLENRADHEQPVKSRGVVGPAARLSASDPTPYHAVERAFYNEDGNLLWQGMGSLEDPQSPGSGDWDEFYLVHNEVDDNGLVICQTTDHSGQDAPSGWTRISPIGLPALAYTTEYTYDEWFRPLTVLFPNGRQRHHFYGYDEDGNTVRRVYHDLKEDGGNWEALSPAEISTYDGGRLIKTEKVKLPSLESPPDGTETYSQTNVLATLTPEYDNQGRLVGMEGESEGESIEAAISYDGFGAVVRQQDPAGTLTRHTYDSRGRLERTFRGTRDLHWFWNNVPYGDPTDDDLVLVEKRYYSDGTTDTDPEDYEGEGIFDTGLLTMVRTLRDQPTNQYFDEQGGSNNEDDLGFVTRFHYDWRMRQVWSERRDEGGDPLEHTITWLDHQDRAVLQASYGASPPVGDADPRLLNAECELPTAADLLDATPAPLSLVETLYNARGRAEEVRIYDVSDETAESHTATRTYYNHAGKPTETTAPNAPTTRYFYDALGRQVRSSAYAGDVELSRTETTYDADNRPIVTRTRERLHDGEDDELDDANSVSSWVYHWYDIAGRIVATANFGTNHSGNTFVSGAAPDDHDELESPAEYTDDELTGCDGGEFEDWVLCTCYGYDEDGRQDRVIHPDETWTRQVFDGLGRLRLTIENAGASVAERRFTAYRYDEQGRLDAMAAVLPEHNGGDLDHYDDIDWEEDDGTIQTTTFIYGADVVDSGGEALNVHPGLISEVHYPDLDPQTTPGPSLVFSYFLDGSVATRQDARNCSFAYTYDELGRLVQVEVDDSAWYGEPGSEVSYAPPGRVHKINYGFTADGRLASVSASNHSQSSWAAICANAFTYDARGNLTADVQDHDGVLEPEQDSPAVEYAWDYSGSGVYNFDRLATIAYPEREDGGARRELTFHYGDSTSDVDHLASRVTAIEDSLFGHEVAAYAYAGLSRRVSMSLGNGVAQAYRTGSEAGYAGLDRFGRIADLHYVDSTDEAPDPPTIHRYQYGYDLAGNRAYARVTHRDMVSGTDPGRGNVRSWAYGHDALQRLVSARMGRLNSANTAIESDADVPLDRGLSWELDGLSNWGGGDSTDGSYNRLDDTTGDGTPEVTVLTHHSVNGFNEIDELTTRTNGGSPVTRDFVSDAAGHLILDEHHFYQYDAWGRMAQANRKGTLTAASFASDGKLESGEESKIGALVGQYVYDGLGRVVTRTWPTAVSSACEQTEHYYYDGVRRVQEQWLVETANCTGGGGGPTTQWVTKREYIHGADYVDEFVAQVLHAACEGEGGGGSSSGHCSTDDALPTYYLQDANYNVVATLDDGCPGGDCGSGGGGCGEQGAFCPEGPVGVYEQYTYEPYGQPSSVDKFITTPPQNAVGHQGLIFDRYCGNSIEDPCITTTQKGLYHNRNRYYHARLGRFTTPDPNSSAIPLIEGMGYYGTSSAAIATVSSPEYSARGRYADGMSLYSYLRSTPVNAFDPSGRFAIGTFGDLMGSTAVRTALTALDAGGKMAMALDFYSAIAGGMSWRNALTDLVINAAYDRVGGKLFDTAVDAAVAGVRAISNSLNKGIRKGLGEEVSARGFAPRGACFAEGTLVWTAEGSVPIESLTAGDRVLTSPFGSDDPELLAGDEVFTVNSRQHQHIPAPSQADVNSWVGVDLTISTADGHVVEIRTIRPADSGFVAECRLTGTAWLELPELGLSGQAEVTSIRAYPEVKAGTGRLVLSTITQLSAHLLRLEVNGGEEIIDLTETHRLYSADRDSWVPAFDVRVGECLTSLDDVVEITGIQRLSGVRQVYNLEIQTDHCYYVSSLALLSHNSDTNPCAQGFRPRSQWHNGVWFDANGFPDFTPHATKDVIITPTKSRKSDFRAANEQAGMKHLGDKPPEGYRWHHHQDIGRMQLVPKELHVSIGHDGGWMVWGGG
ncbi:MAG: hypothetical protein FLDDKLPJ_02645 [Phycisphaerae bacterium]|nr:hypothetical protein [Phycisphaerae bacterium]